MNMLWFKGTYASSEGKDFWHLPGLGNKTEMSKLYNICSKLFPPSLSLSLTNSLSLTDSLSLTLSLSLSLTFFTSTYLILSLPIPDSGAISWPIGNPGAYSPYTQFPPIFNPSKWTAFFLLEAIPKRYFIFLTP